MRRERDPDRPWRLMPWLTSRQFEDNKRQMGYLPGRAGSWQLAGYLTALVLAMAICALVLVGVATGGFR